MKMPCRKTYRKKTIWYFSLLTAVLFIQISTNVYAESKGPNTVDSGSSELKELALALKELFKNNQKNHSGPPQYAFVCEKQFKDKDPAGCISRNLDALFIFSKAEDRLLKRLRTPSGKSIEESRKFPPSEIGDAVSRWRLDLLQHVYKRYEDKTEDEFPGEAFKHYLAYLQRHTISFDAWKKGVGLIGKYYLDRGYKESDNGDKYFKAGLRWIKDYFELVNRIASRGGEKSTETKEVFNQAPFVQALRLPLPLLPSSQRHQYQLRVMQISLISELYKKTENGNATAEVIEDVNSTLSRKDIVSGKRTYQDLFKAIKKESGMGEIKPAFMDKDQYVMFKVVSERMELGGWKGGLLSTNCFLKSCKKEICFGVLLFVLVFFCFVFCRRQQVQGVIFEEKDLVGLKALFDADGRVAVLKVAKVIEVIEKLSGKDWDIIRGYSEEGSGKELGEKLKERREVIKEFFENYKDWEELKGYSIRKLWEELDKERKQKKQKELQACLHRKQRDELLCQKLILDGYFLIRKANREFVPYSLYPLRWTSSLFRYIPSWLAHSLFSLLVMTLSILVGIALEYVNFQDAWEALKENWGFYFLLMAAILAGGLELIHYMARKAIGAIDELVSMLEPDTYECWGKKGGGTEDSSIEELRKWLRTLLIPPFFKPVGIACFLILLILFRHALLGWVLAPTSILIAFYVFLVIIVVLVMPMLWLAVASIWFTNRISSHPDLDINPLAPVKTYGLQKWMSVLGSFAFSLFSIFALGAFFIVRTPFTDIHAFGVVRYFPFFFMIPFMLFYFMYPHGILRKLIRDKKKYRMRQLQAEISKAFDEWKESGFSEKVDVLEKMNKRYEVFKKIDVTKESFWDFEAILTFLKATLIPLALGLYQSSDDIMRWLSEL
jgi:hypothetical protein